MNQSCQVDFYVLASAEQSAKHIACRLAMKAWEQGYRVMVLAADENEAALLDGIMWDFPAGRFLPHSRGAADADAPVSIDVHGSEIPDGRDVVINMADQPVSEPGRFKRLLEIVPGAEQQRLACRQKFRVYREQGLEPSTHDMGPGR
jgi:DNA polymerase-3 subunit chi